MELIFYTKILTKIFPDADHGENARITYSYQETLVPDDLRRMLKLNSETGVISVGEKLDFEKTKRKVVSLYTILARNNFSYCKWSRMPSKTYAFNVT